MSERHSKLLGAAFLAVLLVWRCLARPLSELWRDVPSLLALYALAVLLRKRDVIELAMAAFLLGIYATGQVPLVLSVMGFR